MMEKEKLKSQQLENIVYAFACPQCGDWHEEQSSHKGKEFYCTCGCHFDVT